MPEYFEYDPVNDIAEAIRQSFDVRHVDRLGNRVLEVNFFNGKKVLLHALEVYS